MDVFSPYISRSNPIRILDLGARVVGDPPCYDCLLDEYPCEITLIDASLEECERAKEHYGSRACCTAIQAVIGDGSAGQLNVTRNPSRSSLFLPKKTLCAEFSGFAEGLEVDETISVLLQRLDDLGLSEHVDLWKSDIQGGDLLALIGGRTLLGKVLVAEIEVEFIEQYVDQPLFHEIFRFMINNGFMFHKFSQYGSRPVTPRCGAIKISSDGFGQWLFANAVFVKTLNGWADFPPSRLVKLALIMDRVFESRDFAHRALGVFDRITNSSLQSVYCHGLQELQAHHDSEN